MTFVFLMQFIYDLGLASNKPLVGFRFLTKKSIKGNEVFINFKIESELH